MRIRFQAFTLVWLLGASCLLSGCAAVLVAGGVVGGYAIAKDLEDGKLIDTPDKPKDKGNKGFFSK